MKSLIEHIRANCSAIDADAAYDDMLDEIYSLESVGGPFAHMSASRVLSEVDPTAYRCGFSDYTDSQREVWVEVDWDYYDRRDAEKAKEDFVDELQSSADGIESELEEAQDELRTLDVSDFDTKRDGIEETITNLTESLEAQQLLVKEAEGFDL